MVIPAIPAIPSVSAALTSGASQIVAGVSPSSATAGAAAVAGATPAGSFQNILGQAIDSLNSATNNATNVSLQAAAGNATIADATVASTEADLDTQLASALTDKAVNSMNTIMDMQF
jgi:flagellar hook-basal body complex protein FliE